MNIKAQVILYSRPGCHLCDAAMNEIRRAGCAELFTLEIINIETDAALVQRYGLDIPVVVINGVNAFKHRLDAAGFKKAIRTYSAGGR